MDARRSASEVVKEAEATLTRASALRAEARRLLETAEGVEREARADAIRALGEAHGIAAFSLALLSFPEASAALTAEPTTMAPLAATPLPVPAMRTETPGSIPQPSAAAPETAEDASPGRTSMWGVDVPAPRVEEAKALIAEATAMAAQGKKTNPYATDRGKNAWRRSLFTAVIDGLGNPEALVDALPQRSKLASAFDAVPLSPAPPPASVPTPSRSVDPTNDVASTEDAHEGEVANPCDPEERPSLAEHGGASEEAVSHASPMPLNDPLDDDLPDEPFKSHPVTNRRAGFGNPVPKPPGLAEAQARTAGAGLRPVRRPSFVR